MGGQRTTCNVGIATGQRQFLSFQEEREWNTSGNTHLFAFSELVQWGNLEKQQSPRVDPALAPLLSLDLQVHGKLGSKSKHRSQKKLCRLLFPLIYPVLSHVSYIYDDKISACHRYTISQGKKDESSPFWQVKKMGLGFKRKMWKKIFQVPAEKNSLAYSSLASTPKWASDTSYPLPGWSQALLFPKGRICSWNSHSCHHLYFEVVIPLKTDIWKREINTELSVSIQLSTIGFILSLLATHKSFSVVEAFPHMGVKIGGWAAISDVYPALLACSLHSLSMTSLLSWAIKIKHFHGK